MQVKGLEFGMHEPRLKQGLGLAYAVSAFGADHVAGIHDTGYTREGPEMDSVRQLGVPEPLPANDLSAAKAFMVKSQHMWRLFGDSLAMCRFVPWTIHQQVELLRALTGWEYTTVEALQLGERVATMGRVSVPALAMPVALPIEAPMQSVLSLAFRGSTAAKV